eukprot:CAMPEP_0202975208 /NCGR_PEP_ID=MMETSP1396-20130829/67061_1 /ASSEMBLY_ACC=CAM_ASM_000872 /TAXON_ID= /ORGANISM="Pseudokeronopsis sp., Strain Brazil" /LENGTH=86 /DNA_ID=CAMNT_0049710357 /DNA_START=156 /DNA_END=416 /DNA_ORIENTATION=-
MTEIASYLFREENMEIAVHGDRKKFKVIEAKLEMLLTAIKNDNSRYLLKLPKEHSIDEFQKTYFKNFFKTPLTVNNCVESMIGPSI